MKCPVCGAAKLVHDTRNLPYSFDCEMTTIAAVVGDYCPACDEGVFDAAESARVVAAMLAFRCLNKMNLDQLRSHIQARTASRDADEIRRRSPAWHCGALRDTERRYAAGQEQPIDWAVAKKELRERLK